MTLNQEQSDRITDLILAKSELEAGVERLRESYRILDERCADLVGDRDDALKENERLKAENERLWAANGASDLQGEIERLRNPTKEMIRAGQVAADKRLSEWNGRQCHLDGMDTVVETAYRAMISAAVQSPKGQD